MSSKMVADLVCPLSVPASFPLPSNAAAAVLRPMVHADLPRLFALSDALRWSQRQADWTQVFALGDGVVAERGGHILACGLRFVWSETQAGIGLVIVAPDQRRQGLGRRLLASLLDGLGDRSVRLLANAEGQPLYQQFGFVPVAAVRQHQGLAQSTLPMALPPRWRLRPAGQHELPALQALDAAACGLDRSRLLASVFASARHAVVLDQDGEPRGFALLRRFGRGHSIGPVVAPDLGGAQALIAHLVGQQAGHFTRIDIDLARAAALADWLTTIGLPEVDAPVCMQRGPQAGPAAAGPLQFAITGPATA